MERGRREKTHVGRDRNREQRRKERRKRKPWLATVAAANDVCAVARRAERVPPSTKREAAALPKLRPMTRKKAERGSPGSSTARPHNAAPREAPPRSASVGCPGRTPPLPSSAPGHCAAAAAAAAATAAAAAAVAVVVVVAAAAAAAAPETAAVGQTDRADSVTHLAAPGSCPGWAGTSGAACSPGHQSLRAVPPVVHEHRTGHQPRPPPSLVHFQPAANW